MANPFRPNKIILTATGTIKDGIFLKQLLPAAISFEGQSVTRLFDSFKVRRQEFYLFAQEKKAWKMNSFSYKEVLLEGSMWLEFLWWRIILEKFEYGHLDE